MAGERVFGPTLPPGFSRDGGDSDGSRGAGDDARSSSSDDDDAYGPALPPALSDSSRAGGSFIGPVLPGHLNRAAAALPEEDSDSEGELIGPSLSDMRGEGDKHTSAADDFEARYRRAKEATEEQMKPAQAARESWMTEMPSDRLGQQIGLESRKFRTQPANKIDKTWAEMPADREKASPEDHSGERHGKKRGSRHDRDSQDEDRATSEVLAKHNKKKRGESLMDLHTKKLKKEKEKEREKNEKPTRQAFDREKDLQVNRFDDAQRKSVLKKAALLDTRFSHGERKYE